MCPSENETVYAKMIGRASHLPGDYRERWLSSGERFEVDVRGEARMQRDGFAANTLHSLQYIPELLSQS
jgi:hypothetical protein